MTIVNHVDILTWDDSLVTNTDGGNVFQAAELAEAKRANGWLPRYLTLKNDLSITVLEKPVWLLGKFWYLPKGPGITSAEELIEILPELRQIAEQNRVFAVKLEPEIIETDQARQSLEGAGLVTSAAVQPNVSTVLIDLSPSLETVMAGLNQKGRHAIRRAERDGVTAKAVELTDENMQTMFKLLQETASGRFESSLRSFEYYRQLWQSFAKSGHGQMFFAYFQGEVISAAYCLQLGRKGLYKDGASRREKVTYGASHFLQWEIIRWMKDRQVEVYDLCGAPHSSQINNQAHKFYGVGRFKTSLNKQVTDYVGCYDLVVRSKAYKIWLQIGQRLVVSLAWRLRRQQWF